MFTTNSFTYLCKIKIPVIELLVYWTGKSAKLEQLIVYLMHFNCAEVVQKSS